ncbi:MAG: hypothetical protein M3290_12855 [Actinomycetota bacterium]|nr:hypothetical protein [Actinomycetota bacterium]
MAQLEYFDRSYLTAVPRAEEAAVLANEDGDAALFLRSQTLVARCLAMEGRDDEIVTLLRPLVVDHPRDIDEARSAHELARAYEALGMLDQSLVWLERADEAFHDCGQYGERSEALYSLASTLRRMARTQDALKAAGQAVANARVVFDKDREIFSLIAEGAGLYDSGNLDAARRVLQSCLDEMRSTGAGDSDCWMVSMFLGRIAMEAEDPDTAIRHFETALDDVGSELGKTHVLCDILLARLLKREFTSVERALAGTKSNACSRLTLARRRVIHYIARPTVAGARGAAIGLCDRSLEGDLPVYVELCVALVRSGAPLDDRLRERVQVGFDKARAMENAGRIELFGSALS